MQPIAPRGWSTAPPLLVGREREQRLLRDHFNAALAGHGSLVLIAGELGIGKTALVEDLLSTASEALVATGYCYDLADTPPFGPWLHNIERLRAMLPPGAALDALDPARLTTADTNAERTRRLRDALLALTAQRAVVLVFEDLHWCDPASFELLRFVARTLAELPVLVVVTYRDDELSRRHALYHLVPQLVLEAKAARLDLRPLTLADVQAYLGDAYALTDRDAPGFAAYLYQRSEGNPLFLNELLHSLVADGHLWRVEDGSWRLGDLHNVEVPPLLRQLVEGELARLEAGAVALLAAAAVIGREVPLTLWSAVTGVTEEQVEALIDSKAGWVFDARWTGDGVRFRHVLFQRVLYELLPLGRRRLTHQAVADALIATRQPDPDAVAYHLRQARDPRAAAWLVTAGERAEQMGAAATAAERYEAARVLLDADDGDPSARGWLRVRVAYLRRFIAPQEGLAALATAAQLAAAAHDPRLAARVVAASGVIHLISGAIAKGLGDLHRGIEANEALSPGDQAFASTEDRSAILTDRSTLVSALAYSGRLADARVHGERLLSAERGPAASSAGRAARGATEIAVTWAGLGIAYAMQGEVERARQAYAAARAGFQTSDDDVPKLLTLCREVLLVVLPYLADALEERERVTIAAQQIRRGTLGVDADVLDLPLLGLLLLEGNWQTAQRVAMAIDGTHGTSAMLVSCLVIGAIARAQGEPERAWQVVRQALPDGPATTPDTIDASYGLPLQRLAVALALDAGELPTARTWMEAHDRWLDWMGATLGRAESAALWARYEQARGDPERAFAHAREALARAAQPRQPLALLAVHRLLGMLETREGRYEPAEQHLSTALALADACAAPYERALTLLELAELRLATGDQSAAEQALDELHIICAPLGARWARERAAALAALGAQRQGYPAGLTAREVEVLRSVALGLTNRAIAEQLFISPFTVKRHLSSILRKLNVPTRTAAARVAVELQLTDGPSSQ
jgi:DNA-binding CsgD family transcriptional regulator